MHAEDVRKWRMHMNGHTQMKYVDGNGERIQTKNVGKRETN